MKKLFSAPGVVPGQEKQDWTTDEREGMWSQGKKAKPDHRDPEQRVVPKQEMQKSSEGLDQKASGIISGESLAKTLPIC